MTRIAIVGAEVLDPECPGDEAAACRCLLIEDGRIAAMRPDDAAIGADWERIDMRGAVVAPGFIDVHVHGGFAGATGAELAPALSRDAYAMLAGGTTAFLATSLAWQRERLEEFIGAAAASVASSTAGGAACLGLHLEGPWLDRERAGALDPAAIRPFEPGADDALLDRCEGLLRMVTLAPEIDGSLALMDALAARGVIAALGHTRADSAAISTAIERGLRHVTHLFNAMGPIHHREPGVAGTVLAEDRLSCDLICDGFHVHPAMLRVAARTLGERLVLISDRLDLPGLRPRPGALPGEPLRTPDGAIAGSQIGMADAVRTLCGVDATGLHAAVAAATVAPARLLGIESERGTFRSGARADLAVLAPDGRVLETWLEGRPAFRADGAHSGAATP